MEAARLRLRPILMTAFAFILGVVPLMIASGAGAASRQSLGTTVFGGMLAATILTLVFVPVFYAVIETLRERYMGEEDAVKGSSSRAGGIRFGEFIMRHLKIGLIATAAIAVVATGVVFLYKGKALVGDTAGAATPPHMMAMPVPVTNVVKKDIPIYLEYSARTEAIRNITLQAKIQGYILRQNVPDGADVKEGDLLYTIDPRDSQAALDQAKAQVQRDKAALDYARVNFRSRNITGPERLPRQGHLRSA